MLTCYCRNTFHFISFHFNSSGRNNSGGESNSNGDTTAAVEAEAAAKATSTSTTAAAERTICYMKQTKNFFSDKEKSKIL